MNNEPQNIMNDLTEKFFKHNTIWFSQSEIEELFTVIQVNDTIDSNYLLPTTNKPQKRPT